MPLRGLRQLSTVAVLLAVVLSVTSAAGVYGGTGLVSWDLSPTDDSRGARPSSPAPAASDPPVLLGWINDTAGGSSLGTFSALQNTLTVAAAPMSSDGRWWDLGRGIGHNSSGVTNFMAGDDPDFPAVATFFTDGLDGFVGMETALFPFGGGGGGGSPESYVLQRNPDFVGYEVDLIRLNITSLTINYSAGYTNYAETYHWEIWGHPLFVFFVPPTEPDNAYLIDRNSMVVRVRLAGTGIATLEWDGVNRSLSSDGPNWSASIGNLANGAYAYRVWATNETGVLFATPMRHLTVGVGIWRTEEVGYGFSPSVTVNATGYPRMCYNGGGGLVYAERAPSGWTNMSIESGGQGCSIAVNSKGEARISHLIGTPDGNYDIRYAYQHGPDWSTTTVQHGFFTFTSIAVNPVTDEPMIAYSQITSEGLKLATLSNGVWTTQVVDPSFYGQTTSLAIDPAGNPAIAYRDYTSGALRVARWTGTQWTITTLSEWVAAIAIGFDLRGVAHVAFASDAGLRYATWNGTGWPTETVDIGRYYAVSLSYDSLNRAHLGYAMGWGGDVREAVKDGAWKIQVITHATGGEASFATMPLGSGVAGFTLNDTVGHLVVATDFVDTRPPTTHVFLDGAAKSPGLFNSKVTVRLKAEDDWSGILSLEYRLDGGPWTAYSRSFRMSSDGRHVLEVRATDRAGNEAAATSAVFVIDTNPFSFSGPEDGAPTTLIALTALSIVGLVLWLRHDRARVEALRMRASPSRGREPGYRQGMHCLACGAPVTQAGQFCTNCGTRLTPPPTNAR
jgi:hypothetical protein